MADMSKLKYTFFNRISGDDIPPDHPVGLFASHWRALRGDRPIPERRNFSPAKVPFLLPYVVVLELMDTEEGLDLQTRLEGEYMISLTGKSNMGHSARHVMEEDGFLARLTEAQETLGTGEVQYSEIEAQDHKMKPHRLFRGVFPFLSNGKSLGQVFIVVGESHLNLK
ncbi:PAS domain-containing protein [Emcibacter sp.]|uniref:PAS domain-containing protein n=1 Tax=Emcibacter sp. TaxID=1979954 RepID=UPI002AA77E2B|nr:PAS domain-containing protein [Emcibacter sp.]